MRNAETAPIIVRVISEKTAGELRDTERGMLSSEGSGWKSTKGNSLTAYPTARRVLRGPDYPGFSRSIWPQSPEILTFCP